MVDMVVRTSPKRLAHSREFGKIREGTGILCGTGKGREFIPISCTRDIFLVNEESEQVIKGKKTGYLFTGGALIGHCFQFFRQHISFGSQNIILKKSRAILSWMKNSDNIFFFLYKIHLPEEIRIPVGIGRGGGIGTGKAKAIPGWGLKEII